jgi:hypothetical protein
MPLLRLYATQQGRSILQQRIKPAISPQSLFGEGEAVPILPSCLEFIKKNILFPMIGLPKPQFSGRAKKIQTP